MLCLRVFYYLLIRHAKATSTNGQLVSSWEGLIVGFD